VFHVDYDTSRISIKIVTDYIITRYCKLARYETLFHSRHSVQR